jgi:hypothetical protein
MVWEDIPRFESPQVVLEGEKTDINSVLNREIAVTDIVILPSQFFEGNYITVSFMERDGTKKWFRSSSGILAKQILEMKEKGQLPRRVVIRKIKRYFSIAPPEAKL